MKNASGFTLIEIMLVVLIVAIIVTMSTPRLSDTYRSMKTRAEARKLYDYLTFIRARSVQDQKPYTLVLLSDPATLRLQEVAEPRYSTCAIDSLLEAVLRPEQITFRPNGMTNAFVLTLTDPRGNVCALFAEESKSGIQIMFSRLGDTD